MDENLLQASLDDLPHHQAVITPHSLDPLGVHVVVLIRLCPQQARVALLADEQVRKVNLLKLQLDGLDERRADVLRSLLAQLHRLFKLRDVELDHDRVGISVDDVRVRLVPVRRRVPRLHHLLGVVNHLAAKRGSRR